MVKELLDKGKTVSVVSRRTEKIHKLRGGLERHNLYHISCDYHAIGNPKMKAVSVHAFGGPEVLRYEDAPIPVANAGEDLH